MMSKENQPIGMSRKEALKTAAKAGVCFLASTPLSIPILVFAQGKKEQTAEENFDASQPLATKEPLEIQTTPTSEATPTIVVTPTREESSVNPETGLGLLKSMGLKDRVTYIVYGRPYGWGSLGLTGTAQESWSFFHTRKETIKARIGLSEENFALHVINPAYYSQEHEAYYPLSDDYVSEALRLAPENQGLVALNFNRLDFAQDAITYLETVIPKERLAYLALGFDAEHFPQSQVDARALNQFVSWFALKHHEWAAGKPIPGLVFIYLFPASQILNLGELKQYYHQERTLVVPIFDGWGLKEEKLSPMSGYINTLPDTEASPALLGVMETNLRHPGMFGECSVEESWETLAGTPAPFFATQ
ncbi:MAG: hypothetical protein MUP45_01330 [Candidatus Marinimicrobia bacterium]|nr:hypothetical protein [Candidatus Neomarinimicrobiota bacterium]